MTPARRPARGRSPRRASIARVRLPLALAAPATRPPSDVRHQARRRRDRGCGRGRGRGRPASLSHVLACRRATSLESSHRRHAARVCRRGAARARGAPW